jgi:uncharacterized protein (DUF427 family)
MGIRTEATDKWVRGYVGETPIVDTRDALLFWEEKFPVPGYAFRRDDVRIDLLRPSEAAPTGRSFYTAKGPVVEWYDVVVGDRVIEHAAWVRDDPAISDRIVVSWQPGVIDRWLEEDDEVISHPRDPHKRVEALPSSRHVEVSLEGTVLADSHSPVLLFETDLPTRFYLPREDVRLDVLVRTSNRSECPYKGFAREYWSLPGAAGGDNIAWSYGAPFPAVARIIDRIAFYNELVDIVVDGVPQERPVSLFSRAGNRPTS